MAGTIEQLKQAIREFEPELAAALAKKAVEEKLNPLEIMNGMVESIEEIGAGFERGEYFLPELVGGAAALESAMPIIQEEMKRQGINRKSLGVVVIGTVFGDIHTIGKGMVSSLLIARGFEVRDIGIDVSKEKFVDAVRNHQPQILAMSALLSMTAPETKNVIEALKEDGLRDQVKIMVGGGAVTEEYANLVGADGYSPTAPGAVTLAEQLLEIK